MKKSVIDFINLSNIDIFLFENSDLYGYTNPEIGIIFLTCYCIIKFKGLFRS